MRQNDDRICIDAFRVGSLYRCPFFVQPVFLNHVKDTRYLLICKATDLERFIVNVSTSLVVLCLGMSRSGFFALESESESFDFEYLPIPSPDPILL